MIYFLKRGMEWNSGLGFIQATTVPFLKFFYFTCIYTVCHRPFSTVFFFSSHGPVGVEVLVNCTVKLLHTNLLHIKLVKIVIKFVLLLIKKVLNYLPKIFQGIQNIVFHAYLSTGKGSHFHVCALYFNESDERKYFLRHRKTWHRWKKSWSCTKVWRENGTKSHRI